MSALDVQVGGDHYRSMRIQPIEFIQANNLPFAEGCVVKYVSRWKAKNGLQDLEKAKHYIDLIMDAERKRIAEADALAAGKRMHEQASVLRPQPGSMFFGHPAPAIRPAAMVRCVCLSPADCSGQCYNGSEPL